MVSPTCPGRVVRQVLDYVRELPGPLWCVIKEGNTPVLKQAIRFGFEPLAAEDGSVVLRRE